MLKNKMKKKQLKTKKKWPKLTCQPRDSGHGTRVTL
jgi:hypothetical protein